VDGQTAVDLGTLPTNGSVTPDKKILSTPRTAPRIDSESAQRAPVPITALIDSGQYLGTNPTVLVGNLIGLAEYSNGNFFSNDTISPVEPTVLDHLPYPALSSVMLR